ncbi:MAG: hypothetical protein AB7U82_32905 [Blastocatellales bacterium]
MSASKFPVGILVFCFGLACLLIGFQTPAGGDAPGKVENWPGWRGPTAPRGRVFRPKPGSRLNGARLKMSLSRGQIFIRTRENLYYIGAAGRR